jgi:Flp pilus assembly protein TadD
MTRAERIEKELQEMREQRKLEKIDADKENKKTFWEAIKGFFTIDNTSGAPTQRNNNTKFEKDLEVIHWLQVGTMAAEQSRWQEAVICYDKAISIEPKNAMLWKCKAGALHCIHRFDEASMCINKSLLLDPNDSEARVLKKIIDEKVWVF